MDKITILRQNLMQLAMLHELHDTWSTERFIKKTLKKYPWRIRIRISSNDIYERIRFLREYYSRHALPDEKTLLDVARSAGTSRTCDEVKLLILDGEELEDFKQKLTFRKRWKILIKIIKSSLLCDIIYFGISLERFSNSNNIWPLLHACAALILIWYLHLIDRALSWRAGMKEFF